MSTNISYTERQRAEKLYHDRKYSDPEELGPRSNVDRATRCFWALVGQPRGLTILDFGCGDGWLSVALAKQGNMAYGFDISESLISKARRFAASEGVEARAQFREMAAENIDYDESLFDMVIGTSILHHTELDIALEGIRRTLKPGGRAIFMEPLNQNPALKLWRKLTPWRRTATERAFTAEDVATVRRVFPETRFRYFYLTSMITAALMLLVPKSKALRFVNGALESMDERILTAFPALGRFAAVTVMEMRK